MIYDNDGMVIATDGLPVAPPWVVRESGKHKGQSFPQQSCFRRHCNLVLDL